MKVLFASTLMIGLIASNAGWAAAPSGAPTGTTGLCNDGTYASNAEKKGACRSHKGVKDWYVEEAPMAAPGGPRATTMAPSATNPTGNAKPAMPAVAGRTSGEPTAPAAGGGPGKVWANTSTKVYHCGGDKYYGTTKHGEYMSESDAKAKGYHADHGKACG